MHRKKRRHINSKFLVTLFLSILFFGFLIVFTLNLLVEKFDKQVYYLEIKEVSLQSSSVTNADVTIPKVTVVLKTSKYAGANMILEGNGISRNVSFDQSQMVFKTDFYLTENDFAKTLYLTINVKNNENEEDHYEAVIQTVKKQ